MSPSCLAPVNVSLVVHRHLIKYALPCAIARARDGKPGGDGRDAAATAAAAAAAAATLFGGGGPGSAAAATTSAAAQAFLGMPAAGGARPMSGGPLDMVGGLGGLPGGLPGMSAEVGTQQQQQQQQQMAEALAAASLSTQTWFADAGGAGGDIGDLAAALKMEPAANLSNMLNPNNVHYDHQLASWWVCACMAPRRAMHPSPCRKQRTRPYAPPHHACHNIASTAAGHATYRTVPYSPW